MNFQERATVEALDTDILRAMKRAEQSLNLRDIVSAVWTGGMEKLLRGATDTPHHVVTLRLHALRRAGKVLCAGAGHGWFIRRSFDPVRFPPRSRG